jgi:DNA-binding NarL/FixJ family response regulator
MTRIDTSPASAAESQTAYVLRIQRIRAVNEELREALEIERQRLLDALAQSHGRRPVSRGDRGIRPMLSRLEASRAEPVEPLTRREQEVLRCIAEGSSTKQTAARLGITFKTAACHRHRIMQKLGVHETTSLVRFAIRSGLVQP